MTNPQQARPLVPILVAIYIVWGFGYETVVARLRIAADGVVISSQDSPSTGAPRYATYYVLRGPDGQNHPLVAGATDGDLPRTMPVGTKIKKLPWHLGYERDGKPVDDFPVAFYSGVMGLAISSLIWGILLWRSSRRSTAGTPR